MINSLREATKYGYIWYNIPEARWYIEFQWRDHHPINTVDFAHRKPLTDKKEDVYDWWFSLSDVLGEFSDGEERGILYLQHDFSRISLYPTDLYHIKIDIYSLFVDFSVRTLLPPETCAQWIRDNINTFIFWRERCLI